MPKTKNARRKDGRLQKQIYIGRENGKRKYVTVYAQTQKELEAKATEAKQKLNKGIDLSARRDKFSHWGEAYIKYKSIEVSENWLSAIKIYYKKLEPLYDIEVTRLRANDIKDILMGMVADGYSRRTIKAVYNVAVGILKIAVENRVVDSNPFANQQIPNAAKPAEQRRALTATEQSWIRDTPHRAQTAAMIMMYAGLRRGELIPLTWSDIDLKAKTINVNKSVEMINGQPKVKTGGKTESATRTVYIPSVLADYLAQQPHTTLLVCPSASGKLMSDSAWRRLWDSYIKELNFRHGDFGSHVNFEAKSKFQPGGLPIVIPPFTAHWLRHTFVTLMYLSGVDVLTAKEQAGHANIQTTLDIYSHLDREHKAKNVNRLDEYIAKQAKQII